MEQSEELLQAKELVFNEEIKDYVNETAKWGTFLAIMGYIGISLMALISVVILAIRSTLTSFGHSGFLAKNPYLFMIYLVLAVVYFFPVHFLYRFSSRAKAGLKTNDQRTIAASFKNLKLLYKFSGILLIVVLALYAIGIVVAVAAAAASI